MRGETVSKIFDYIKESVKAKCIKLLIKTPSDLYQMELSYFYKPDENIMNIFIHVSLIQSTNT
jgi:hypothetical protein